MLWTLISQFLGVGLPAIFKAISEAQKQKLDAKTEHERIAADERIEYLQARKDVILQSQKNKLGEWIRAAFAIPYVIYLWKLLIWDKVAGWGTTDGLSPTLHYILMIVLAGYFVDVSIKSIKG